MTLRRVTDLVLPLARVIGRGAGVGLESSGVGEAGPVVSDLGEHPGAGERADAWEAGDDPGVRVLVKRLDGGGLEVVGAGAGGVELAQQGEGLAAHGLLDEGELAHLLGAEGLAQPLRPRRRCRGCGRPCAAGRAAGRG